MTSRPLAFTDDLVLATKRRQKTETRRLAKIDLPSPHGFRWSFNASVDDPQLWEIHEYDGPGATSLYARIKCPYGVPGDEIWMRERWGYLDDHTTMIGGKETQNFKRIVYLSDNAIRDIDFPNSDDMRAAPPSLPDFSKEINQNMTDDDKEIAIEEYEEKWWKAKRSMSPRVMPKYAARGILEILDIGLDFVKNIKPEDIWREGVGASFLDARFIANPRAHAAYNFAEWEKKWNSIYTPKGKPHSLNSLVWVVKFKVKEWKI